MVTGGGGYIGSRLVKTLLANGFQVFAVDRFFFGQDVFCEVSNADDLKVIKKDTRSLEMSDFLGVHGVIDLAAMSNDPSAELDPRITYEVNGHARVRTAELAARAGVRRYILASSCAVYGAMNEGEWANENSNLNPLTTYSKSCVIAENGIIDVQERFPEFSSTILRNSTVFGSSRRMRFDLVLNLMVLDAVKRGRIQILGGGNQWRPLVHIQDIIDSIEQIIVDDSQAFHGQLINIGHSNFQIRSLAYEVRKELALPIEIIDINQDADKRNYKVSFEKAKGLGLKMTKSISFGISEVYEGLRSGELVDSERTRTIEWYSRIMQAERLYNELNVNGRIMF